MSASPELQGILVKDNALCLLLKSGKARDMYAELYKMLRQAGHGQASASSSTDIEMPAQDIQLRWESTVKSLGQLCKPLVCMTLSMLSHSEEINVASAFKDNALTQEEVDICKSVCAGMNTIQITQLRAQSANVVGRLPFVLPQYFTARNAANHFSNNQLQHHVACNLLKAVFVGLGEMEDKFVTDLSLAATALQPMLMLRAIPRDLRERAKAAVEQLALDESNRLEQQVAQQQLLDQQQPAPVSPVITEDDVAAVPDLSSDVSFVFSDEEEEEERDTSVTDELSMYWRERGQQTTDPNGRSIPDLNANPLSCVGMWCLQIQSMSFDRARSLKSLLVAARPTKEYWRSAAGPHLP